MAKKLSIVSLLIMFYQTYTAAVGIDASIGKLWNGGGKSPVLSMGYFTRQHNVSVYEWGFILRYSDNIGKKSSSNNQYGTIGGAYAYWFLKNNSRVIFGVGGGTVWANKEVIENGSIVSYTDYKPVPYIGASLCIGRFSFKISNLQASLGLKFGEV